MGESKNLVCIDPTSTLTHMKAYRVFDPGSHFDFCNVTNDKGNTISVSRKRFVTKEQARRSHAWTDETDEPQSSEEQLPFGIKKETVFIIPESDKYEEERCDNLPEAISNARQRLLEEWLESVTEKLDYMNNPTRDNVEEAIIRELAANPVSHLAQLTEILGSYTGED